MLRDNSFSTPGPMAVPISHTHSDDSSFQHPNNDNNLDDIFGSAPSSPSNDEYRREPSSETSQHIRQEVSDIPRLRSEHSTAGYRDGLATAKGTTVQAGFDEGYTLGAVIGLRVGAILGTLEGLCLAAMKAAGNLDEEAKKLRALVEKSRKELKTESVFGTEWWGEDGIWKFEVAGTDVTFPDVADSHPLLKRWENTVKEEAERWGIDLGVLERGEAKRLGDEELAGESGV